MMKSSDADNAVKLTRKLELSYILLDEILTWVVFSRDFQKFGAKINASIVHLLVLFFEKTKKPPIAAAELKDSRTLGYEILEKVKLGPMMRSAAGKIIRNRAIALAEILFDAGWGEFGHRR